MKEILIILDGLMEERLENKDLKKMILGDFSKYATLSMTNYVTEGKPVDSLNCIFKMLGYSPSEYEIGDRAYYEALSMGIKLKKDETILRCNIALAKDNKLLDFTGGNLGNNLNEKLRGINIKDGKFINCDNYKNLLILTDKDCTILNSKCYAPHFNVSKDIRDILPNNEKLKSIIDTSKLYFNENNLENRILWPWGPCKSVDLESFNSKHNKSATLISGINLVHGMGIALGMHSIKPNTCNGYYDTSLSEKLNVALIRVLEDDVVIIHVNGLDELSHKKCYVDKLNYMEKIRKELIIPIINSLKGKINCNIKITCDHRTDSYTGMHDENSVPEIIIEI
ncbi:hypothetical protein [Clostridium sp.]|uniref:hypothetical protein n=1 Tax=Clostridium sp. TaxID=1506 RepID=UPI002FC6BABD